MDRFLQESFGIGACSSFEELAQRYRHKGGEKVGMVHAMLLYTVRAVLLLESVRFLFSFFLFFLFFAILINSDFASKDRESRATVTQLKRKSRQVR